MALLDSTVTRDHFEARAKVSAGSDRPGVISFSINTAVDGSATGGRSVFVHLSPWEAECIARLLLSAAGERRAHDETM